MNRTRLALLAGAPTVVLIILVAVWVAGLTSQTMALLKTIHLLAVIALVGGTFFNYTLVRPAQKAIPPPQAAVIATKVGQWFTWLVWIAIPTILLSGLLRLILMGRWNALFTIGFYGGRYGRWLLVTVVFWAVMVISASTITFYLNPALTRKLPPTTPPPSPDGWKLWKPLFYSTEIEQPLRVTISAYVTWVIWISLGLVLLTTLLRLAVMGLAGKLFSGGFFGTDDGRWLLLVLGLWLAFASIVVTIRFIVAPMLSRKQPVSPQPSPADVVKRQQVQITFTHRLEQLVLVGLVAGALAAVAASSLALGGWF